MKARVGFGLLRGGAPVFSDLGTRCSRPRYSGAATGRSTTHVEASSLIGCPRYLIVLGGAMRPRDGPGRPSGASADEVGPCDRTSPAARTPRGPGRRPRRVRRDSLRRRAYDVVLEAALEAIDGRFGRRKSGCSASCKWRSTREFLREAISCRRRNEPQYAAGHWSGERRRNQNRMGLEWAIVKVNERLGRGQPGSGHFGRKMCWKPPQFNPRRIRCTSVVPRPISPGRRARPAIGTGSPIACTSIPGPEIGAGVGLGRGGGQATGMRFGFLPRTSHERFLVPRAIGEDAPASGKALIRLGQRSDPRLTMSAPAPESGMGWFDGRKCRGHDGDGLGSIHRAGDANF